MIELNKLLKQIQNINLGRFSKINTAYVIGDLHGDLNKFLLFLKSINIIKSSSFPINYDSYKRTINEMKIDVINNIKFISLIFYHKPRRLSSGSWNFFQKRIHGFAVNADLVVQTRLFLHSAHTAQLSENRGILSADVRGEFIFACNLYAL